jgi:hypothetical protein
VVSYPKALKTHDDPQRFEKRVRKAVRHKPVPEKE